MKRLTFTGERLIPGLKDSTFMYGEHVSRYLFAAQFAKGKIVADLGCGVGFGAKILAEHMAKVVYASDISTEAIDYAKSRYSHKKVKYKISDVCASSSRDSSINLAIAFELIEHVQNYGVFLEEVKRILKPNGLFLLSTPNAKIYPQGNSFHYKEFGCEELERELKAKFKYVKVLYQINSFASLVSDAKQVEFKSELIQKLESEPSYFIVLASNAPLPKKNYYSTTLFSDFNFDSLAKDLNKLQREVIMLNKMLAEVHASRTWKLLRLYQLFTKQIKLLLSVHFWEQMIMNLLQKILPNSLVAFIDQLYVKFIKLRVTSLVYLHQLPYVISSQNGLTKYSVIVFSAISWLHKFQRPQHLATKFAEAGHPVFYIEPNFAIVRDANLGKKDIEKKVEIKKIAFNIFTVKLVSLKKYLIYQDLLSDPTSIKYLTWSIESLCEKVRIKNAVFKVDWPFWQSLIKEFNYPVVYDCIDEHSGFWTSTQQIIELEKKLIASAQLVLTTADLLLRKVRKINKRVVLVNNACQFEHFNKVANLNILVKQTDKHLNPTIGYFGAIADWLDDSLVEYLAKKRPHWNFVLIGNIDSRAKLYNLRKLKNIQIINEVKYSNLPAYLRKFSAFFVPFKVNKLTLAVNPVKMYEMFATGRPSVWTNLPEVKKMGKLALVSRDKNEFLSNLEKAVKENDLLIQQKRIAYARKNTWDDRLFDIEKAIAKYIFPKVSIIVLSYNTYKYTKLCLDNVVNNSNWPNMEIIVVDNGSTDGTTALLKQYQGKHPNLKAVLLKNNLGFAGGNNIGLKEATGEYIILLNSDTIVTKNWIRDLILHLSNKKVGLVGPLTNAVGNEAKIEVSYKSLKGVERFADKISALNRGKSFDIDTLAFFCVAGRRSTWKKIGLLDERFKFGTFEDDDYCLRARNAGYRILCAEDVFIHHFLGKTRNKINNMDQAFQANKKRFENKWQRIWVPHRYRPDRVARI